MTTRGPTFCRPGWSVGGGGILLVRHLITLNIRLPTFRRPGWSGGGGGILLVRHLITLNIRVPTYRRPGWSGGGGGILLVRHLHLPLHLPPRRPLLLRGPRERGIDLFFLIHKCLCLSACIFLNLRIR